MALQLQKPFPYTCEFNRNLNIRSIRAPFQSQPHVG